jgi:hypothetical protein
MRTLRAQRTQTVVILGCRSAFEAISLPVPISFLMEHRAISLKKQI